jgi:hypothetical protein
MKALTFWKTGVSDKSDFLERIISLLVENRIPYCVLNDHAVNAYADPVVSLDLDIAVALERIERAEDLLRQHFEVERFAHSINASDKGSDLRVQVQTDERYSAFVGRAEMRDVLGEQLSVAAVEDVLQGKIWAASDPTRRQSKRLKDFADIARILEGFPHLAALVPDEIRQRLL